MIASAREWHRRQAESTRQLMLRRQRPQRRQLPVPTIDTDRRGDDDGRGPSLSPNLSRLCSMAPTKTKSDNSSNLVHLFI